MKYVIGIDYGTDSCRALLVNAATGEEIAAAVKNYPRWAEGKYCNPSVNQYRQHPLDYIETLMDAVREILEKSPGEVAKDVVGISFDTTGSTPALTDGNGTPLALLPAFSDNPNAMFVLWKDHTAIREASEINRLAKQWPTDYTRYVGGIYSSEWDWSKVLHLLREDPSIRKAAYAWVEHCDWMPALLTGNTKPETLIRSRCAAGHKALWHTDWGGLPSEEFLETLDPLLTGFRSHLYNDTYPGGVCAGYLTGEWAEKLGLPTSVAVSASALDCHAGAVGAQIKPGSFVRVMGTSTCDVMVASYEQMKEKWIAGICGQVDGSVIPGMIGLEAGQSAFGDVYAWFGKILEWPIARIIEKMEGMDSDTKNQLSKAIAAEIIPQLSREAEKIPLDKSAIIALDWMNGRRTPDANQLLKGSITGISLGTTAPMLFKALVEATAYGSKAIVDRFLESNIHVEEVIAIGGIAQKSPFVMQTLADVLNRPIKIAKAEQACALGAAMFAAVSAGVHPDVQYAQKAMGQGFCKEYVPDEKNHRFYLELYRKYRILGKFTEEQTGSL
ncbi:MAG: ribulokinase [Dysgonamonadaceae bacterium]|jgi:L-ribulokinase|nr:ribulokinase [Dysgonamonadaceae bacterium]